MFSSIPKKSSVITCFENVVFQDMIKMCFFFWMKLCVYGYPQVLEKKEKINWKFLYEQIRPILKIPFCFEKVFYLRYKKNYSETSFLNLWKRFCDGIQQILCNFFHFVSVRLWRRRLRRFAEMKPRSDGPKKLKQRKIVLLRREKRKRRLKPGRKKRTS